MNDYEVGESFYRVSTKELGEIMVESNFVTEKETASALKEKKRRLKALGRSGAIIFLGMRESPPP